MKSEIIKTSKSRVEYHFREKAESSTLVFLHGLGANQEQFIHQCAFFSRYFQVITLNLPGHGNSESSEPFNVAGCAQDIIDLFDALEIEKFHFVGNSMGGNIGYELLGRNEHRLLSLTTFGTTAVLNTSATTIKVLTLIYRVVPMNLVALLVSNSGQTRESRHSIKTMVGKMKKKSLLEIIPVIARFN